MPTANRPDSSGDKDRKSTKKPMSARQVDPGCVPEIAPSKALELDLRTLMLLSLGDWSELADLDWPPQKIRRWLAKADIRQVRGLLLMTLDRWHELRQASPQNE